MRGWRRATNEQDRYDIRDARVRGRCCAVGSGGGGAGGYGDVDVDEGTGMSRKHWEAAWDWFVAVVVVVSMVAMGTVVVAVMERVIGIR